MIIRVLLLASFLMTGCGSKQKKMAEMSPEYRAHVESMDMFEVSGHELRYVDKGEGEIFLLVHGIPTNSWMYRKIIRELSTKYRVVAPDLIGFGQSSKPYRGFTVEEHGEVLRTFLKDKLKVKKFNLMVHDFGGPIALSMLGGSDYEVNQAVILDTFLFKEGWNNGYNFFSKTANQILPGLIPDMFFKTGLKNMFSKEVPKYVIEGYLRPLKSKNGKEAYSCLYKSIPEVEKDTLPMIQKTLKAKLNSKNTKIVWGREDPFLDSEKQVDKIAKSIGLKKKNILILEKGKHLIADENAQEILDFIVK